MPDPVNATQEYFSCHHPDWGIALMVYFGDRFLERGHRWKPALYYDLKYLTDATQKLALTEDKTRLVFQILEEIGLAALRPTRREQPRPADSILNEEEEARILRELRQSIWTEIDGWYEAARSERSPAARAKAAQRLQRVGRVLGGDRRGKKGHAVDPQEVRATYYRVLFPLERALELLKVWPWDDTQSAKVRSVAEAVGMQESDLRSYRRVYLQLDPQGRSKRRPFTPENQARKWTGEKCGISEQTVANLLVGPRKSSLRKKA